MIIEHSRANVTACSAEDAAMTGAKLMGSTLFDDQDARVATAWHAARVDASHEALYAARRIPEGNESIREGIAVSERGIERKSKMPIARQ
jgi:hypothetical protein